MDWKSSGVVRFDLGPLLIIHIYMSSVGMQKFDLEALH